VGAWTGSIGLRMVTVLGACECGSKPSGSIKWGGISSVTEDRLACPEGLYSRV